MDDRSYDMELYSGQYSGDLGDFQKCRELSGNITAYCLAIGDIGANSLSPPIIGFCVTANCTTRNVLQYLETTDVGYIRRDFQSSISRNAVNVFCQGQSGQRSPSETLGIAMVVVLLFILCVCVIATVMDVVGRVSSKAARDQSSYEVYTKGPRTEAFVVRESNYTGDGDRCGSGVSCADSFSSRWVSSIGSPTTRIKRRSPMSVARSTTDIFNLPMKEMTNLDHSTVSNRRGGDERSQVPCGFMDPEIIPSGQRSTHTSVRVSTGDSKRSVLEEYNDVSHPLVDDGDGGNRSNNLSACLLDHSYGGSLLSDGGDSTSGRINKRKRPSLRGDGTTKYTNDGHANNTCIADNRITPSDSDFSNLRDDNRTIDLRERTDVVTLVPHRSSFSAPFPQMGLYNNSICLYDNHSFSRPSHIDPITKRTEALRAQIRLKKEEVIRHMPDMFSFYTRFTLCFSLLASLRRWMQFSYSPASVLLFHSVRTMCWVWIVVVDVFKYTSLVPSYVAPNSINHNSSIYVLLQRKVCDSFAIGTLLLISGFTCGHQLAEVDREYDNDAVYQTKMKHMRIQRRIVHYLCWYVIRLLKKWVRLVPLYAAVVFITQSALLITRGGPFWPMFLNDKLLHGNCMTKSMYNFMFINNFLPTLLSDQCFPWTYYFAVDFQLFCIAPFIHLFHNYCKIQFATVVYIILCVLSVISRFYEQSSCAAVDNNNYKTHITDALVPSLSEVFRQPQSMVIPFVFGILLFYAYSNVLQRAEELKMFGEQAIIMLEHSSNHATPTPRKIAYLLLRLLNLKKFRVICLWLGMIGLFSCVLGAWGLYHLVDRGCEDASRVFFALIIVPWCLSLFLFFIPMMFGYGGVMQKFLTQSFWVGLSKLILGAYLTHPIVLSINNATKDYPMGISPMSMAYEVCGTVSITLLLALLFHLMIEQPCIYITRTTSEES
eukprot:Tbor_TRINITY_DN5390_c0_g1::TRINITY_DN5390_c0_g1_i1::g.5139::m.5139